MLKNYTLLLTVAITLCFNTAKSQFGIIYQAPLYDNSTSMTVTPNNAPSGAYMRGCFLVTPNELAAMTASGTTNISALGFLLNSVASVAQTSGNLTIYFQNTSDVAFNKSTTFATALTGMSMVHVGTMVIPSTVNTTSIVLNLSNGPFAYTGGGLYVAYEWNTSGPFFNQTPAVFKCNSTGLAPGGAVAQGSSSPPLVLTTTAYRPSFLFGVVNTFTNDVSVLSVNAPGKIAVSVNATHSITAIIKNTSNISKTNVVVSLNVNGANTFANTQTITSILAGATTTVTFLPFSPTLAGVNNMSVSVPADQKNTNNSATYTQVVTCDVWSQSPPNVPYTGSAVGFQSSFGGIISMQYNSIGTESLSGINAAISNLDPNCIGINVFGVVLDAGGNIIAQSNAVMLTNAMLGTFLPFTFSPPFVLNPADSYYIGMAQMQGPSQYFPFGTNTVSPGTGTFYSTNLFGGNINPAISSAGYFGFEAVFATTVTIPALINSPTVTCGGGAVLSATTNAISYTWAAGPTNTSYVVSPMANTIYTLTLTNAMGCTDTHTTQVSINLPITVTSNPPSFCAGNNTVVTVSASGANSYTWSTNPPIVASSFTVNPTVTTVYNVQASNGTGCIGSAAVTVAVNSFTNFVVSANGGQACAGQSFTAAASGGITYTWTTGTATLNTPSISQSVTANTSYTVLGTDVNGCKASTVIPVTLSPSPTITATSATINCGGIATLTANSSDPYSWTGGPANANYVVNPLINTTYSVTSTNAFNCSISKTVFVIVNPIALTVTSNTPSICMGNTVVVTAGGATSYSWNISPSISANSFMASPAMTTTYVVTGMNAVGCSGNAVVIVYVYDCTVGIEKVSLDNSLSVYPNPFKNNVTLLFENEPGATDVIMTNLLGETILQVKNADKTTQLDLSNHANGVYFITIVRNGQSVKTIKAVKRD